jgi:threonine synthase
MQKDDGRIVERGRMSLQCSDCGRSWPLDPTRWRCDCGGVLEIEGAPSFDPSRLNESDHTLWRYRAALPLSDGATPVTLGEGGTPLVATEWEGQPLYLKAEHLNPTGSFKDRGAALLVTALKAAGARDVADDSSGNAGAALAAYAARAGLCATVYAPAHASPVKQRQIAVYGAEIAQVPGPRSEAARAARQAVENGAVYASHAYSPFFAQGMKTIAFELWEQLGKRAPGSVMVPVGHGALLLGLHRGFAELLAAGLIERWPRLFGVQVLACAPLARAWERGASDVEPVEERATVAGGVCIAAPVWGRAILAGVRESDGAILALPDEEILVAQEKLAHQGVYVEPTSALVVAALERLRDRLGETPVAVLTGSGFKTPLPATDWQQRVVAFIRRYRLRHDPSVHALDLVSEVGEVAKEVLLATDYGQREPEFRSELTDELGDAFYSLLALTNACDVDADSALNTALKKYEHRLAERGTASST